jgi:hypothetical protein
VERRVEGMEKENRRKKIVKEKAVWIVEASL